MPGKLLIDAGHTRVKWRFSHTPGMLAEGDSAGLGEIRRDPEPILALIRRLEPDSVWLAATAPVEPLINALEERVRKIERVRNGDRPAPVMPAYDSLGVDRWLAMLGAWTVRPDAWCVVDLGSAVTVDVIDPDGKHRGGWIAAGPGATIEALARTAPRLPAFDAGLADNRPAIDSPTAVASGLLLQQAGMIERCWREACLELNLSLSVIVTGGGAKAVQSLLDIPSRRDDDLVFKGLLSISDGV